MKDKALSVTEQGLGLYTNEATAGKGLRAFWRSVHSDQIQKLRPLPDEAFRSQTIKPQLPQGEIAPVGVEYAAILQPSV